MKKTLITSFIALLILGAPAFAETITTSDKAPDITETPFTPKTETKVDALTAKKQKIDADMRATITKLAQVIDRVQVVIDLLNKNNRDTTLAASLLSNSKDSLKNATDALNQFSGIVSPDTKTDAKALKTDDKVVLSKPVVVLLKDPLKKSEDSLKDSKASLISSINALKEGLAPKDSSQ